MHPILMKEAAVSEILIAGPFSGGNKKRCLLTFLKNAKIKIHGQRHWAKECYYTLNWQQEN